MGKTFDVEPGAGLPAAALPPYAAMLQAYHRSRDAELRAIVATLPLGAADRVLDVASGDGYYCQLLAECAGAVIGVDLSAAYLEQARQRRACSRYAERIHFQQAEISALAFGDNGFDLVWCAHSLFSLPDPLEALHSMARVARAGGYVAILEHDSLHKIIMPWPAELERAVRQAQRRALAARCTVRAPDKFYVGRDLAGLLAQAGLHVASLRTFAIQRRAPLTDDEEFFLHEHFTELRSVVEPQLDAETLAAFDLLVDPGSRHYLFRQPTFHLTQLEMLAIGRKP
jgi:SAM-dependent methyltransferase